ncbi:MAG: hypothetical protein RR336_11890, partial [Oscillospiraceae bacterium]
DEIVVQLRDELAASAAGTPAAGTPAAGTPATTTPAAGTPAAGTPATTTPATTTPAATTPATGTPATTTPTFPSVAQLPGGDHPDKEAIRALENYDITKELTLANEHREREGIISLVCKDIVGLVASAAAIDPTGLSSGVMAGVTAINSIGLLIRDGARAARSSARNHGRLGANVNKSDQNKLIRRHNLAVMNFDQMKEIAEDDLDQIKDSIFASKGGSTVKL